MPGEEPIYQIALTLTPQIGCIAAKTLVDHFGNANDIFKAKESTLGRIEGIGPIRARSIKQFNDFDRCREEIDFAEDNGLKILFLTDKHYPQRLLNCADSPTVLYLKGDADLNYGRIVSIVGTRRNSDYGRAVTDQLIADLAKENVLIVSGLAFGIDTLAHRAALKNGLPTVAVMAHGLDTLYPPENARMAKQMIEENGGLLSEFMSGTKPDKHNFPTRNRLAAGMADATVVIETDIRGGSMITAELAFNYNRDVFAFPGKATDPKSRGCNHLIRANKAGLISCAADLLEAMNWMPRPEKKRIQRSLFLDLTPEEKIVTQLLELSESLHVDELMFKSGLSSSAMAGALLTLELQGVVASLPGKLYKLV